MTSPIHVTTNTHGFRSYAYMWSYACVFDDISCKAMDGRAGFDYYDFDNVVMLRFPIFISSWWNKKKYTGKEMIFNSWHRVAAMRLQMIQPVYGEDTEIELPDR